MKTFILHRLMPACLCLTALMTAGCLEETDTIHVHEDGRTTVTAVFSGQVGDFPDIVALPQAPAWMIAQNYIDSSLSSNPTLHLTAHIDVPYGQPLPHTFAKAAASDREQQLQFPTEIKMWTEGNRTYYEFRRTYQARRYGCYNIAGGPYWDQDLEDSVIQEGIFNVTEQQRQDYLQQFGMAYGYLQWRMHWQAMSDLIGRDLITKPDRALIDSLAYTYLEATVTNDRLLALLKRGEDSLSAALDSLTGAIDRQYEALLAQLPTPLPAKHLATYRESLAFYRHDYDITEALGSQNISVNLVLPGTLLDTNGLIDPDEPRKIRWEFKGTDLHDHDLPLYARSVVVNQ